MRIYILGIALALLLSICSSCETKNTANQDPQVSWLTGHIENLADTTLVFTYDEYEFLSDALKPNVTLNESGDFSLQIEHKHPLKGFFSLGRIPKTYEFTFKTVDERDSSMQVPSADFRMIYIYLEPGDSVHFEVDADAIEQSLRFSGTHPANNTFVNAEEFRFNDYPHKYLGNYYNKTYREPNDYKRVTAELSEEKQAFLKEFDQQTPLSQHLKDLYLSSYLDEAVSAMIHYPAGHAGFNDGKYPELPVDYYDFMDEVSLSGSISDLGIGHYYFLNSFLRQKYKTEHPEDSEMVDFYPFALSELEGESGYEFLAYALGRDFNKALYDLFGANCPYPVLAQVVKDKYQHLEGMLAGSAAPPFTLENPSGELISLADFRGQFVYIDFWATWCKPCVKEFPDLKRIQAEYQDQNISFISISIDKEDDKDAWKAFVADEKLGGTQLIADPDTKDRLSKALNIKSIPRFVILDTEGRIVDANAPRPSDPRLVEAFEALGL